MRSFDHAALSHASRAAAQVHCVFVFDTEILDHLLTRVDRRVEFIWRSVLELRQALRSSGGGLRVVHGRARIEIPRLARALGADVVFANRDYEPVAIARDAAVAHALAADGIEFRSCKDQVIFERDEILTQQSRPFTVFTPYQRAWLAKLADDPLDAFPIETASLAPEPKTKMPSLEEINFQPSNLSELNMPVGMRGGRELTEQFFTRIDRYHEARNFPSRRGVSYLSVHLRFGTVSVRELVRRARAGPGDGARVWLSELIWREFYFQILWHFPEVVRRSFRPEYERLAYPGKHEHFLAWCAGQTGYPLVDAAMRQLNHSGYMHNRLRMVSASFLVKDLLIDWRAGERYFAQHLNDFDLAANNGGWQWCASTGCDAQPYFRIFNPVTQSEKFDPQGRFIRMYVPELRKVPDAHIHTPWLMGAEKLAQCDVVLGRDYPMRIVDHHIARAAAIALHASARRASPDTRTP